VTDPIAEALDKFVPAFPSAEGDWQAILSAAAAPASVVPSGKIPAERSLRRSGFRRRVPARVVLVAAVVVLAFLVTAVAFGWPQRFVDFFSSPPAPTHVKNWFGAVNAKAPPGMSPLAISGQTRKITTARFNAGARGARPRLHTLYVAPTKGGGFCFQWTRFAIRGLCGGGGGFGASAPRWMRAYGPLWIKLQGVSSYFWQDGRNPYFVYGTVSGGATRKVEARFADGTTATIHVTWVSAPINAGFIAYPVPRSHWDNAHALSSVVALDANGRVIGSRSPPGSSVMAGMRMTMPPATPVVAGRVAVPNLIDLRLDLSERTLARDHLRFNGFAGDNPPRLPDIAKHAWVCFQSPKAGKRVPTGTRIALLFASDCHQGGQGHEGGQGLP
jgi:hypothetical protein